MKKIFYVSYFGLLFFELFNVYFIMPMPGSQEMNSIDLAYFLFTWRWLFRVFFASLFLLSLKSIPYRNKWPMAILLLTLVSFFYIFNYVMAADAMFKQPDSIHFETSEHNKVSTNRLVIGVVIDGVAKAYPIQYLGYHHFIYDSIQHHPILVTYCTVCRTGRVYKPEVNYHKANFRLVGMDHFNAMIEDKETKSWWQQATGEAIAGPEKGNHLPEIHCKQTSLAL